jgi:hypothetical protein
MRLRVSFKRGGEEPKKWNKPASCEATSLFPPAAVRPQAPVFPEEISLSRMTLVSCSNGLGEEPVRGVVAIIPERERE